MLLLTSCVHVTAVGRVVVKLNALTVLKTAILRVMCTNLHHFLKRTILAALSRKTTSTTISASRKFLPWRDSTVTLWSVLLGMTRWQHLCIKGFCQTQITGQQSYQKLTKFWRICALPEVLGRWYTRRHDVKPAESNSVSVCYCRTATMENTVSCSNPKCQTGKLNCSCLGIVGIPKLWYCPNCRTLPEFKCTNKGDKTAKKNTTPQDVLNLDFICLCKQKVDKTDRLVE